MHRLSLRHLLPPPPPAIAATIGVPGDQPTIQAGIDAAAAGDFVVVACGTYCEHDIVMKPGVHLRSEGGQADCATIDAQWLGRVMYCVDVDETSTIEGFTMTGGSSNEGGGGLFCDNSSLWLTNCELGAIGCTGTSSPVFIECAFSGNAGEVGSAVDCSSATHTRCIIAFGASGACGIGRLHPVVL